VLKYIYIIGGGEGLVYYNGVFVLDTVTQQWTSGNISTMTPARLKYIYINVRKRVQLYYYKEPQPNYVRHQQNQRRCGLLLPPLFLMLGFAN
jgi:hypothetical protein